MGIYIDIGIGIGIVLLNRERVTLVRERSVFMCGSAPGHPFFFFKHSSPLLHMEQLLRTRYMWSFPMFAATGKERRKAPTGRRKACGLGYPAATPISDVAVHTSDARISTPFRAHPHVTHIMNSCVYSTP